MEDGVGVVDGVMEAVGLAVGDGEPVGVGVGGTVTGASQHQKPLPERRKVQVETAHKRKAKRRHWRMAGNSRRKQVHGQGKILLWRSAVEGRSSWASPRSAGAVSTVSAWVAAVAKANRAGRARRKSVVNFMMSVLGCNECACGVWDGGEGERLGKGVACGGAFIGFGGGGGGGGRGPGRMCGEWGWRLMLR